MGDVRGPLPAWLAPASWLMARVYGAGVAVRNARLDRGAGVQRFAAAPVVSVGNLSAGGTGKSPFVAWCARVVADAGVAPVIAMRGYGAGRGGAQRSDEALEYGSTAPMARVIVGARRYDALVAEFARAADEPWTKRAAVLLDDGFQHRMLARDLDIVLVDATRPALDGDLLPHGWLREPARNIARAGFVVLTKAHDPAQRARAAALVAEARGRGPDAVCEHLWRRLVVHRAGETAVEPVGWLSGRRVLSACALGNPRHFHAMVERATGACAATLERADHAAMTADEIDRACERADAEAAVISRKDLVKLASMPRRPLVVPELELGFIEGEAALRAAVSAAATRRSAS